MRHRNREATLLTFGALLLWGCGSSESSTDTDGSTGSGATASDGKTPTDTPSYGRPAPCESSAECEEGQSCIAPYDQGAGGPGPSVCVEGCIEEDDLSQWCVDNDSCCGELRCHEVDGFCEPPVDDGSTDSGSSTATDTSSTTSATGSASTGGGSTGTATGTATGTDSQETTSTTTSG